MSTSWLLHERGRLGEEGKVWELLREASLRVGRSSDCDIVLQTQTVEQHHAEFLWNHKLSSFIIRDLGSVNGTYINNSPLRGSSASLSHNDALRFGYDKERVFRIEKLCSSSKTHSAKKTTASGGPFPQEPVWTTPPPTTTTSIQVSTVAMPTAATVHTSSHDLVGMANSVGMYYTPTSSLPQQQYQSVPLQLTNQGYMYTSTPPLATVISAVASGHGSSGPIPLYSSPVPPAYHAYSSPSLHSTGHPHQHLQDTSYYQTAPIISSSLEPMELASSPSVHRSDGRRAVNLEQSPALNQASKLYGEPLWWGNEKEGGAYTKDKEYEFSKPGTQILRDIDSERVRKEKDVASLKLSLRDELRLQTIAGSRSQDNDAPISPPSSSWTVDFGSNGGVNTHHTLPRLVRSRERVSRPRSADPSPNRLHGRRDVSPLPNRPVTPNSMTTTTTVKRRSSLNLNRSKPNSTPVPGSPKLRQRAATPPVTTYPFSPSRKAQGAVSPAAPPMQSAARKQRSATPPVMQASPARRRANTAISYRSPAITSDKQGKRAATVKKEASLVNKSPVHSPLPNKLSSKSVSTSPKRAPASVSKSHKPASEDKAESEGGEHTYVVGVSDDSSSLSSLSDPSFASASDSVVVVTPESAAKQKATKAAEKTAESEESVAGVDRRVAKGSSGRKQWIEEDSQPCTDTLMMASIEARMRRLSQLAHQTARQVTSLKSTVQEGHPMEVQAVNYLTMRTSSPVMNKIEQSLPEWKCFNKEANSIFRNIRIVEKWLQDIDANLKCIRPMDGASETVDYFSNDSNEEETQESTT